MENGLEKRILLAVLLSVLVLLLFRYYYERTMPAPPPQVHRAHQAKEEAVKGEQAAPPPQMAAAAQVEKREITVESSLYRAVLSNVGGTIKSWKLKRYKEDERNLFEMVPQFLPPSEAYFLRLDSMSPELDRELNWAHYEVRIDSNANSPEVPAPASITFVYQRPGLLAQKTFSFDDKTYVVRVSASLKVNGADRRCFLVVGPAIGGKLDWENPRMQPHAVARSEGKVARTPANKIEWEKRFPQVKDFAGVETQYFAAVFLPEESAEMIARKYTWSERQHRGEIKRELVTALFPASSRSIPVYIGPKEYETLNRINPALSELIDYGMFAPIVKALLFSLKLIYRYVHNYGVAIIILTFIISLALFPIRYKQVVSMKKMQRIQPKIKAIQEKYKKAKKSDPDWQKRMNIEIMQTYKEHGVNPLGGCLPLLLQMPILFAFYSLLAYSIELRKASFIWWIKDLSEKDPYYITPTLMGLTMFLQQKMTPSAGTDPTQNRIMMLLPLIFTFMFFNLSSGLNLYFLFSNIFGIAFQLITERMLPKEDPLPSTSTAK